MPRDAQIDELVEKYDRVCDVIDNKLDDINGLDEEDPIEADEIHSLEVQIEELEMEADDLWGEVLCRGRELVTAAIGHREELEFGNHECVDSPTGSCVYDAEEDPCQDSCLFCGDPRERK